MEYIIHSSLHAQIWVCECTSIEKILLVMAYIALLVSVPLMVGSSQGVAAPSSFAT